MDPKVWTFMALRSSATSNRGRAKSKRKYTHQGQNHSDKKTKKGSTHYRQADRNQWKRWGTNKLAVLTAPTISCESLPDAGAVPAESPSAHSSHADSSTASFKIQSAVHLRFFLAQLLFQKILFGLQYLDAVSDC